MPKLKTMLQNNSYEITCSLLNQWLRIWNNPVEDNDSYQEFLNTLDRIPTPDNEYMQKGREYEKKVYDGQDEIFSPIVKGGDFQTAISKKVEICGMNIMLYGKLDCLKAGKIYDIKYVREYTYLKYIASSQHSMYLELVPNAKDFTYLVCDYKGNHYREVYDRTFIKDIKSIVADFLNWLKLKGLMEKYKDKWCWEKLHSKK